jgi:hypothetical protein
MPELITHTVAAYIIRKRSIPTSDLLIYLFGAMLPDLLTRPFMILYPPIRYFINMLHTPFALALVIYLISQYFEDSIKTRVMKLLALGTFTHLFLDLFQNSVQYRGYSWLFPFTFWDFRIGLFWPEDSVAYLPVTLAVLLVDFILSYKAKHRK